MLVDNSRNILLTLFQFAAGLGNHLSGQSQFLYNRRNQSSGQFELVGTYQSQLAGYFLLMKSIGWTFPIIWWNRSLKPIIKTPHFTHASHPDLAIPIWIVWCAYNCLKLIFEAVFIAVLTVGFGHCFLIGIVQTVDVSDCLWMSCPDTWCRRMDLYKK